MKSDGFWGSRRIRKALSLRFDYFDSFKERVYEVESSLYSGDGLFNAFKFIEHCELFVNLTMPYVENNVAGAAEFLHEILEQYRGARQYISGLDYSVNELPSWYQKAWLEAHD